MSIEISGFERRDGKAANAAADLACQVVEEEGADPNRVWSDGSRVASRAGEVLLTALRRMGMFDGEIDSAELTSTLQAIKDETLPNGREVDCEHWDEAAKAHTIPRSSFT